MKDIEISVIVPCYNAQRYLQDCLESLRAQKGPQMEMIFIDDGSADETGAMLDQFALHEPRARVVHTANGGVSSARNRGLDLAQGRYIAFMDADDALEEGALDKLYRHGVQTGAQIVSANHVVLDVEQGCRVPVKGDPIRQEPLEIVCEIIHMHRIYNNIWNKLYHRTLFDGLRLDEGVRIGEDALLNLQLYLRADSVSHLDETTYVYRVHSQSAMAGVKIHSEAHQPMLRAMSKTLIKERVKERFFCGFLQSAVWIDEKERGIRACMQTFDQRVRPLVLEGVEADKLSREDARLYRMIQGGIFPAFYMLMRVSEKLTGKKWGIRR